MYESPARDYRHSDAQHEARQAGHSAGWDHANFVGAYGPTADSEPQGQYEAHADIWREAYAEGVAAYEALREDELMYGHDWTGGESAESFTVRTMADGENYFQPREFDSEILAEAYYSSTLDRIRREDSPNVEVTVDMANASGDVLYSHTFPLDH